MNIKISNIKKGIFYLFLISILFSCNEDIDDTNIANATVLEKGQDCGNSFLIKFNENVENLPSNDFENVFYEINLPEEYRVNGTQINATFREPNNDELMNCTTQASAYPQIFIINVE